MPTATNIAVLLDNRPQGWPTASNFRFVEAPVAELGDGDVLVQSHFLSLDPYMRGRMSDGKSYVPPVALGAVMCGEVAGEVLASRNSKFGVGDKVRGDLGWQLYAVSNGNGLRKVDPRVPLSANLSVVGMPGATAWRGLVDIGGPKAGETVVVSAAAGAVGGIVGQIAKIKACRAVGIAGGADKCRYVVDELGFDACVDYKGGKLREELKAATPGGVDIYFDNVGGEILDAVLARMNPFSRLPLCGLISQYNASESYGVKNFRSILVNRIRVQGFIVFDDQTKLRAALADLAQWVAEGRLRWHETIAEGIHSAPEAFIGMLRGQNLGKQLVKLI
jgi:NADPH-dependent curcumin reductase CurA